MLLGSGILGWHSNERHTDRYGAVHLSYGTPQQATFADAPVGSVGVLSARVVKVVRPASDFDTRHGLIPIPEGETVVLGDGLLFREEYNQGKLVCIGVEPSDGRVENWMNPKVLYRIDGQHVELHFDEA